MRKLLTILNAVLRDRTPWQPPTTADPHHSCSVAPAPLFPVIPASPVRRSRLDLEPKPNPLHSAGDRSGPQRRSQAARGPVPPTTAVWAPDQVWGDGKRHTAAPTATPAPPPLRHTRACRGACPRPERGYLDANSTTIAPHHPPALPAASSRQSRRLFPSIPPPLSGHSRLARESIRRLPAARRIGMPCARALRDGLGPSCCERGWVWVPPFEPGAGSAFGGTTKGWVAGTTGSGRLGWDGADSRSGAGMTGRWGRG